MRLAHGFGMCGVRASAMALPMDTTLMMGFSAGMSAQQGQNVHHWGA